jgi:hypothetical protein
MMPVCVGPRVELVLVADVLLVVVAVKVEFTATQTLFVSLALRPA